MVADGGHQRLVPGGPAVEPDPVEIQGVVHDLGPVQHQFGGDDALLRGVPVDGAAGGRGELIALEDHPVDGVGEERALHPVHDHVAHGDLARQGLVAALGVDDVGEPVQSVLLIIGVPGLQSPAAREDVDGGGLHVPHEGGVKGLHQHRDGQHGGVLIEQHAVLHIEVAAVGLNVLLADLGPQGEQAGLHLHAVPRPGDGPRGGHGGHEVHHRDIGGLPLIHGVVHVHRDAVHRQEGVLLGLGGVLGGVLPVQGQLPRPVSLREIHGRRRVGGGEGLLHSRDHIGPRRNFIVRGAHQGDHAQQGGQRDGDSLRLDNITAFS